MKNIVFVMIPLLLFAYLALNGIAMTISPLSWAQSKWTAKGQYEYDQVAQQVSDGKELYWRFAGFCMTLLSIVAVVLVLDWAPSSPKA